MSKVGMLFSALMIFLVLAELAMVIRSINTKNKRKSWLHLLGLVASSFVSIFTITSSLQIDFKSPKLAIVTFILATVFFIWFSIDTITIENNN